MVAPSASSDPLLEDDDRTEQLKRQASRARREAELARHETRMLKRLVIFVPLAVTTAFLLFGLLERLIDL